MLGCGGWQSGWDRALAVAFEEPVDEHLAVARPSALTGRRSMGPTNARSRPAPGLAPSRRSRGAPPRRFVSANCSTCASPSTRTVEIAKVFLDCLADSRRSRASWRSEVIEGSRLQPA